MIGLFEEGETRIELKNKNNVQLKRDRDRLRIFEIS
jgi:hypothetical protein